MAPRLKRKDIIVIGLVAAVVCFFVTIAVVTSGRSNRPYNYGFGQDMDCRPMPIGEPVCIRKPTNLR
jgi:hypothetical protein